MLAHKFEFTGADGRQVKGEFDLPENRLRAYALLAHCFGCGPRNPAATHIARGLASHGIGVFRFDFADIETREPTITPTIAVAEAADLVAAAGAMSAIGKPPSLLIGHSLGGTAALLAASDIATVRAVATIGSPLKLRHHATGVRTTDLDLAARLPKLGKSLLVMHAPSDEIVGVDQAALIFGAARHPKSFISLDQADHLLTRAEDRHYVAAVIAAWASRYCTPPADPAAASADATITKP